jgi:site-specific recombinase XerD
MATEAIEAGVSRDIVQRFLGHQASASTDIYTRGAVVDLRQVHERRRQF